MRFQPIELDCSPDEFFLSTKWPKELINVYSSAEHIKVHPSANQFKITTRIINDILERMADLNVNATIGSANGDLGIAFMDDDSYHPVCVAPLIELSPKNRCAAYLLRVIVSHCSKANFFCDFDAEDIRKPNAYTVQEKDMLDLAERLTYYKDHEYFTGAISNCDQTPHVFYYAGFSQQDYENGDASEDLYNEGITYGGFIYINDFCDPEQIKKAKDIFSMMRSYDILRMDIYSLVNSLSIKTMIDTNQLEIPYVQLDT